MTSPESTWTPVRVLRPHRVGEEDRRELLPEGDDEILRARARLADERDAAENRRDLLDLAAELRGERFVEIDLLADEGEAALLVALADAGHEREGFLESPRGGGIGRGDELVRDAGEGRHDDDRAAVAPLGDDLDRLPKAIRFADRRAAELDDDHGRRRSYPRASGGATWRLVAKTSGLRHGALRAGARSRRRGGGGAPRLRVNNSM